MYWMDNRELRKYVVIFVAAFILIALGKIALSGRTVLTLVVLDNEWKLLAKETVVQGQEIAICYNHSVMKVPVCEIYQVKGDGPLVLSELVSREPLLSFPGYEHYTGSPTCDPERLMSLELNNQHQDWFIAKGLQQPLVTPLMVGSADVDHKIILSKRVIRLSEYVGHGQIVRILIQADS